MVLILASRYRIQEPEYYTYAPRLVPRAPTAPAAVAQILSNFDFLLSINLLIRGRSAFIIASPPSPSLGSFRGQLLEDG